MSTDLSEGQSFGAYDLLAVAGTGGMGVVYRSEQRSLGRTVALKVIRPEIAQSGDYRLRFLREARLAAAVDHPHVVSVFDVGEHIGRLYLAMQWIDGVDLRTILARQQRLPAERTVRIGVQLAMALEAVHRAGLLHRDVKPANVLVRDMGGHDHAYLADFGVSKMAEADSDLTRTGWMIGTAGYLSPEQIKGHQPDSRSDLYALGCIIFEALTGERPFNGANDQALRWAHASNPRPVASAIYPALGPRYDEFLLRALALDPQDRFQSGSEFAEALRYVPTERLDTQVSLPSATRTELWPPPSGLPPTAPGSGLAPTAHSSGEPGPTAMRPTRSKPVRPVPSAVDGGGRSTYIPPASEQAHPKAHGGIAPGRGRIAKLIVLASSILFLISVTLLPNYINNGTGPKTLLQATSHDLASPLYPHNFWIPVVLVSLVLIFTIIALVATRRSLMAIVAMAALGLVGYTFYIPQLGPAPGFGPYGSGYWLSFAAAITAFCGAVAAFARSKRADA